MKIFLFIFSILKETFCCEEVCPRTWTAGRFLVKNKYEPSSKFLIIIDEKGFFYFKIYE